MKCFFTDENLLTLHSVYINHRPAFCLNPADLHQAFNVLADQLNPTDGQPELNRENLLTLLQQHGEHMSDYEMADCLANLLHLNNQSNDMFETMNAEDACNNFLLEQSRDFSSTFRFSFRSIHRKSIT